MVQVDLRFADHHIRETTTELRSRQGELVCEHKGLVLARVVGAFLEQLEKLHHRNVSVSRTSPSSIRG